PILIAERAKYGAFSPKSLAFGVLKIAVMGILSYEFFAPFARNYSQSYSSVEQSNQTSRLSDYLGHFGVFVFLITGLLVFHLNRALTRTSGLRTLVFGGTSRRAPAQTATVMASSGLAA